MSYTYGLKCTLYDSNFNEINNVRVYGSEQSPDTNSIGQWLSQGTYYVSVSLSSYEKSGNYKLYASFSTSGITAADKDSFDLPQNMGINSKVAGALTYSNKVDWYKVSIPAAGKYTHILQSSNSMVCRLYDGNLSELSTLHGYSSSMATKEIELKPGTYYMKIEGYVSSSCGTYSCQLKEAIPAKGDVLTDSKNQAKYKVTKAGRSGGTVTYQKCMNGVKASVTIPSTVKFDGITYKVTGIAPSAFKDNRMLKKVIIGKNVTSIGRGSFYRCKKLETLKIGSNVVSIGELAFMDCSSLKAVTIPAKVQKIGKQAFYRCINLRTVKINTKKLVSKNVGRFAFSHIYSKVVVKVPASCLESYKKLLQKKGLEGKNWKIKK